MRTREAAMDWFATRVKTWTTSDALKTETAAAGDLGYTYGKYDVVPVDRAAYTGYYVRVWTRKADGSWQLAAETVTPPPPPKR
jgi:ketosteroid isomerase-like protein